MKRLRVMVEREAERVLVARVEIDDPCVRGKCPGRQGHGSESMMPLVLAVEANKHGHPLFIKLSPTQFNRTALPARSESSLNPESYVVADGLGGFRGIIGTVASHHRIGVTPGPAALQHAGSRWVNRNFRNLSTAFAGTYHGYPKYGSSYWAELQFRLNPRFALSVIVRRLVYAEVATTPCP